MPSFCAVVNCNDKYGHADRISFHKFPFKRKDLLKRWKDFTQRDDAWMPSKWSAICSRHFLESDFNCVNERKTLKKTAVPTVRLPTSTVEILQRKSIKSFEKPTENVESPVVLASVTNLSIKATCRFCGAVVANCISFGNNFETFGMIQKCFPTLQIQQNDILPKEMCLTCQKSVERFARFIDKVLETQSELQRRYRTDRSNARTTIITNNINSERQLKIKQEPIVRVKQEIAEGLDRLFDLDIGMDDVCEQDQPDDEIEQKFQFCDFPMLNAQDIINNCDIMEIINLDDPFINITDDDVGQSQTTELPQSVLEAQHLIERRTNAQPGDNDMFQTELLIEEHNYANPMEERKEQWQLKCNYKTEKLDSGDVPREEQSSQQLSLGNTIPTEPRSTKPIVTNVSQIPNPLRCDLLPTKVRQSEPSILANTKPNIVVLNDSIVKSSDAFTLHSCNVCALKFFTNESLSQHYEIAHPPMVSMPMPDGSLKVENNDSRFNKQIMPIQEAPAGEIAETFPQNYWHSDWSPSSCEVIGQNNQSTMEFQKNFQPSALIKRTPINILDMQQSFLRQSEEYANALCENKYQLPHPGTNDPTVAPLTKSLSSTVINVAAENHLAVVTANYTRLQRRYRHLRRKCNNLVERDTKKYDNRCQRCSVRFRSIYDLLRHKRIQSHFVEKPQIFAAKCCGCLQHFHTRLALQQHMNYICQSLPLRCSSARLQNFKCRHCNAITFTHWRLYCRHALKCKLKVKKSRKTSVFNGSSETKLTRIRTMKLDKVHKRSKPSKGGVKSKPLPCAFCGKLFATINSLNQHRITHSNERRHKCGLCGKVFKRRNGLSQHVKGYHMKIKPFSCPVCKHCYALKCDMLRCRHSQLRGID